MPIVDKNRPSPEWIEHLRRTLPCEREIDRVLTQKMLRRAGPPYSPVSLQTLVESLNALLSENLHKDFRIIDPCWMTGGASKLQMSFLLDWHSPEIGRTCTHMVLRMEPAASNVETSRLREFQIIDALAGHLPVPPVYWLDGESEFLPYPAIIFGYVDGVTKPTGRSSGVTGMGTTFPSDVAKILGQCLIEHMSILHRFNWKDAALDSYDVPSFATQSVEWQINWWLRVWEEDANEDIPLLRLAIAWLRQNQPPVDCLSMVHGDLRTGNFLYNELDNRITAILDWETAHIGDRHEDIVYMSNAPYRQLGADGKTVLLGGLLPEEEFYEMYEKTSGLSVIPKAVKFYKVLNCLKVVAVSVGSCYRAARNGKTHQDVLIGWALGIGYVVMDDLRRTLEDVL